MTAALELDPRLVELLHARWPDREGARAVVSGDKASPEREVRAVEDALRPLEAAALEALRSRGPLGMGALEAALGRPSSSRRRLVEALHELEARSLVAREGENRSTTYRALVTHDPPAPDVRGHVMGGRQGSDEQRQGSTSGVGRNALARASSEEAQPYRGYSAAAAAAAPAPQPMTSESHVMGHGSGVTSGVVRVVLELPPVLASAVEALVALLGGRVSPEKAPAAPAQPVVHRDLKHENVAVVRKPTEEELSTAWSARLAEAREEARPIQKPHRVRPRFIADCLADPKHLEAYLALAERQKERAEAARAARVEQGARKLPAEPPREERLRALWEGLAPDVRAEIDRRARAIAGEGFVGNGGPLDGAVLGLRAINVRNEILEREHGRARRLEGAAS